ncbi:MAG TPA: DUF3465 domain-containing protein [Cellvibrionaceae bacterium]
MKKILSTLLALCAIFYRPEILCAEHLANSQFALKKTGTTANTSIDTVFKNHQSDVQVAASGTVIKLLADDNDGSRHQKFLVRLSSGLTLLIAHNIDLAPRVNNLKVSDAIEFFGEYEWNEKGGVIHWTHQDPRGVHPAGWLKHKGQKYQ